MQQANEIQAHAENHSTEHDHGDPHKRQAIVEAARVLFTTRGYEPTTMSEVARKAGVAVGTVYLYFHNKTDLLYAVKTDWERVFLSYMAGPEIQAIPVRGRARPLIKAAFDICEQHTEMVQLMALQPEMVGDRVSHEEGSTEQMLAGIIKEAIDQGVYRPVDPERAAVIAFGMVSQALLQCFVIEKGENKERYIDSLADVLDQWLLRKD